MNLRQPINPRGNWAALHELMIKGTRRATRLDGESHRPGNFLKRVRGQFFITTTIVKMIKHLLAVIILVKDDRPLLLTFLVPFLPPLHNLCRIISS